MIGRRKETEQTMSPEDEALRLFVRARSGQIAAAETAAAAEVLTRDARKRDCHDQLKNLWNELDGLASDPAILQMREDALTSHARSQSLRVYIRSMVAALLVMTMVGGAWTFKWKTSPDEVQIVHSKDYATRVGETSSIALPDQSVAIIDTNSALRAHIGKTGERRIEILRGRVMFSVAKMRDRPFVVKAGGAEITALGTQFDVYRKRSGIEVNLIEGKVQVRTSPWPNGQPAQQQSDTVTMSAGDRLQISDHAWHIEHGAAQGSPDWVKGQITFDEVPVAYVIDELNRYTEKKFFLSDPKTGLRNISAVIRTNDPAMLLRAIKSMNLGSVKETKSGYEIGASSEIEYR